MSKIEAIITGNVVADPETRQVGQYTVHEFPVYVNHQKKDKDSGAWAKTGDVSKIRVSVWGDKPLVKTGDLIKFNAALVEKTFAKKDGSEGRQLQTEYVGEITILGSAKKDSFTPDDSDIPF